MVDRVLIGDHPSFGMGLYVSQPSINVNTATKFQMSWSTLFEQFQIVTSGSAAIDGDRDDRNWSATFTWTNLGYYPIIFISCDEYEIELEYLTTSSARMRRAADPLSGMNTSTSDTTAYFIVTRSIKP